MIENIKNLWDKIEPANKKELAHKIAYACNVQPLSVYNNWLSGFYAIPEKHQETVLTILQNKIALESEVKDPEEL